jgi:hypothetical protein
LQDDLFAVFDAAEAPVAASRKRAEVPPPVPASKKARVEAEVDAAPAAVDGAAPVDAPAASPPPVTMTEDDAEPGVVVAGEEWKLPSGRSVPTSAMLFCAHVHDGGVVLQAPSRPRLLFLHATPPPTLRLIWRVVLHS